MPRFVDAIGVVTLGLRVLSAKATFAMLVVVDWGHQGCRFRWQHSRTENE